MASAADCLATMGCGVLPSARRTVRRGLSASTVPIPTGIASCAARNWWVRVMDSVPLNANG